MKFPLYSKSGEFMANVETRGAFTPDIIVWGHRYFLRLFQAFGGPRFQEAILDTAVNHPDQTPPKQ